jgi:hypothetical protein
MMNKTDMEYIEINIWFLKMSELYEICKKFNVPYKILLEIDGKYITSQEKDRKKIIINKIVDFLNNKIVKPTVYSNKVICFEPLKNITKKSKIFYGQYKNGNKLIFDLLNNLTDNDFKFGALSCELINKFWSNSISPSYEQFAKKYIEIKNNINDNLKDHPEWRFLNFLKDGGTITQWKKQQKIIKSKIFMMLKKLRE